MVRWVSSRLEASGYTVWIDRTDILAGARWERVIPREIRNAEALLLMLTPNAAQSDWVRREFFYALRKKIRIIPILVRPAELAAEMDKHVSKIQTVVLWNRRGRGFEELLHALGGLRGVAAQVPGALDQAALQENTRLISELLRMMQTVLFGYSTPSSPEGTTGPTTCNFSAFGTRPRSTLKLSETGTSKLPIDSVASKSRRCSA